MFTPRQSHQAVEVRLGLGAVLVSSVRVRTRGEIGSGQGMAAARDRGECRRDQADRAISTAWLNASLRLHLRPIDVVVCHGPI